jgi:hypothetical protein
LDKIGDQKQKNNKRLFQKERDTCLCFNCSVERRPVAQETLAEKGEKLGCGSGKFHNEGNVKVI